MCYIKCLQTLLPPIKLRFHVAGADLFYANVFAWDFYAKTKTCGFGPWTPNVK